MPEMNINDHLVLLSGASATGKSASLMELENQEGVMYLNCESGKKLPFKSKFQQYVITDPYQIEEAFDAAFNMPEIHTIVVDSLTYLMDMFESMYVINSSNTMKGWSDFAQFFKRIMQEKVPKAPQNVIFTAHTLTMYNESEMEMETKVPVKGALKNNGIESYFSVVISSKKMTLKKLKEYSSDLLNITEEEEALGFKYVFQTRITRDTVNERMRGPMGLFSTQETFTDNNMQLILNRLHEYYD